MTSSATFVRPPLDKSLTMDQIYEWHRKHSPDFPAFVFPDELGNQAKLTWKALGDGINNGIDPIRSRIPRARRFDHLSDNQDPIVVGILATTDVITYTTFLFSHIRLTHPGASGRPILPFPISTRNSAAAVAHLVGAKDIKYIWVTEGPMRTLIDEALIQGGLDNVEILNIPSFSELYVDTSRSCTPQVEEPEDGHPTVDLDRPALILHSSGSTAFPKPLVWTHRFLLELSGYIEQGDLNVEGDVMAVHSSPLFHSLGVSGYTQAAPSPRVSTPPMTPESFLEQIVESQATLLLCVPSFLESWAANSNSVQAIKRLKAILWGGGPLQPDTGVFLLKEGVSIRTLYGATEFGAGSFMSAEPYIEGHEWFEFPSSISIELMPEPEDEGLYELIIKTEDYLKYESQESETHTLAAHNTEINGVPAYATNDIIERHPTNSKLFRIQGRKDDQIMLGTGEKTNPGPLENIIVKNPHVKNAIMFGRSRLSNGILIEPTSYEEAGRLGLENFRNLIWSSIKAANDYAPAHSRIFKETILVASALKPFSYTAKQSVRRGAIIKEYASEIEAMYQAIQDSSQTDIPIPPGSSEEGGWTLEESLQFVREAVHKVMASADDMGDDDDIFGYGCDSLQATYIRNTILHALRQVAPAANVLKAPSNFVYQHPTVRTLAVFAARISHTTAISDIKSEAERRERLQDFVARYTQNWPVHRPSENDPTTETIILTGSTGGLGSHILAQLLTMPSVSRVYAFNRPGRKTSHERHFEAFLDRGIDITLLKSEKIVYVEGDSAVEGFNIKTELFEEIRDSVTSIIHNAWQVDFNISLASFEPAIRGVRNMVDLALKSPHASPPRVMFTSSVGIIKSSTDIPPVAESPVTDLSLINASGYGESKWISERILWNAGHSTALHPVVVRVGQLSGGVNGNWNSREWFPALVRASQVVGGAPDNAGLISFLPVHVAASALIELRHTSSQFVHLVHPRPVPWTSVIQHVADNLHVPVIPYEEWLSRLKVSPRTDDALHRNPALHLIDFYQFSTTPKDFARLSSREAMGVAMFETKISATEAPSLAPARLWQLGKCDVNKWIGYWKSKGALEV
ncbi:acetyl-CoA synthetase-like protein [Ramaria rubella]|nr:acetyl-CoA synthetase-like protein [Ramaria rubella]